jgi:hypothetical protein
MRSLLLVVVALATPMGAQALKLDIRSRPDRLDSAYLGEGGTSNPHFNQAQIKFCCLAVGDGCKALVIEYAARHQFETDCEDIPRIICSEALT